MKSAAPLMESGVTALAFASAGVELAAIAVLISLPPWLPANSPRAPPP